MKAAVIESVGRAVVTEVPDPAPGPRDVVVEVAACGLCGTDLHILQGEFAPKLPIVPGHEFARRGGRCRLPGHRGGARRPGRGRPLPVLLRVPLLPQRPQQPLRALGGDRRHHGGWRRAVRGGAGGELRQAPGARPHPGRGAHRAAVLRGARLRRAPVAARRPCADLRLRDHGPDDAGAGQADRRGERRHGRPEPGAPGDGPQAGSLRVRATPDELDRPQGWDLVIDATGNAAAIQDGLGRVAKAGTFLQFGVADYATRVEIDPYRIYNQEITITGSMAVLHSYERAAELFANGVLDPDVFISDRLPWTSTRRPWSSSRRAWAARSWWCRSLPAHRCGAWAPGWLPGRPRPFRRTAHR